MTKPAKKRVTPLDDEPAVNEDALTGAQVAQYFGVTVATVTRWDRSGKLKSSYRTPGGHRRYSRKLIEDFINNQSSEVTENHENDHHL